MFFPKRDAHDRNPEEGNIRGYYQDRTLATPWPMLSITDVAARMDKERVDMERMVAEGTALAAHGAVPDSLAAVDRVQPGLAEGRRVTPR